VIRNNIFGFYPRHGVSFWQETDNPKLGSSDNKILYLSVQADPPFNSRVIAIQRTGGNFNQPYDR